MPPAGRPAPAVVLHPRHEKVSFGDFLASLSVLHAAWPLCRLSTKAQWHFAPKKTKGKMACKITGFTVGETEAQTPGGQLRLTKGGTDHCDCCVAAPLPSSYTSSGTAPDTVAQQARSASPPLLQWDLSSALSQAGKSIPDMQLSSQLTLAGSDPGEGHLPSPAALSAASKVTPAAGSTQRPWQAVGTQAHADSHRPPGKGGWFYTPAPSGLLPHTNSTQPLAGAGQNLPWLPPPPACSCHPLPGAGSHRVCRYHHNTPGGESSQGSFL